MASEKPIIFYIYQHRKADTNDIFYVGNATQNEHRSNEKIQRLMIPNPEGI